MICSMDYWYMTYTTQALFRNRREEQERGMICNEIIILLQQRIQAVIVKTSLFSEFFYRRIKYELEKKYELLKCFSSLSQLEHCAIRH